MGADLSRAGGDSFVVFSGSVGAHAIIMHDRSIKERRSLQEGMASIHASVTPNIILVALTAGQ